ncbi:MAG: hypothetical protein KatS3mg058_4165 [Roseiflexus sp.]|nr:MAG: hypothetical protein KatS3mg058_4165 [Roseiflexus sp.]
MSTKGAKGREGNLAGFRSACFFVPFGDHAMVDRHWRLSSTKGRARRDAKEILLVSELRASSCPSGIMRWRIAIGACHPRREGHEGTRRKSCWFQNFVLLRALRGSCDGGSPLAPVIHEGREGTRRKSCWFQNFVLLRALRGSCDGGSPLAPVIHEGREGTRRKSCWFQNFVLLRALRGSCDLPDVRIADIMQMGNAPIV